MGFYAYKGLPFVKIKFTDVQKAKQFVDQGKLSCQALLDHLQGNQRVVQTPRRQRRSGSFETDSDAGSSSKYGILAMNELVRYLSYVFKFFSFFVH